MAQLYQATSEGAVVALSFERGIPSAVQIQHLSNQTLIVTSFGMSQEANAQFIPSLRNSLFIYSFGDALGSLEIGGIAAHSVCSSGDDQVGPSVVRPERSFAGVSDIVSYYDKYGIGKTVSPIQISVGRVAIIGYLRGFEVVSLDPQANLMRFTLRFAIPPGRINSEGQFAGNNPFTF